MKNIILTKAALDFENKLKELVGKVLKNVFYKHDVKGFTNLRARGETRFEYIPLSNMVFETDGEIFYKFYDSTAFLSYYGFYTLDFVRTEEVVLINSIKQSELILWSPYINQKIEKVEIDWDILQYQNYKDDPSDLYPKGIRISFSKNLELVIVASELDLVNDDHYKFICPDEALIVCFSQDIYDMLFGEKS